METWKTKHISDRRMWWMPCAVWVLALKDRKRCQLSVTLCYLKAGEHGAMAGLKSRTMLIGFDWESSLREDEAVNKPVNSWIHCEHDVTLLNEGIIQINAPSALVFGYITPVASLFFKLPLGEMFPQEEFNYHSLRNLVPTWWIFMLSRARPLSPSVRSHMASCYNAETEYRCCPGNRLFPGWNAVICMTLGAPSTRFPSEQHFDFFRSQAAIQGHHTLSC